MNSFTMQWLASSSVLGEYQSLPIRQVYVWCLLADGKFLIVSKDGENWQLPGGKPDSGEEIEETAVREVREETGLELDPGQVTLTFFGYYVVTKTEDDGSKERFLQIRLYAALNTKSGEIAVTAAKEDRNQAKEEQVQYVKAVTGAEAEALIPWLAASGEYRELKARGLL